LLDPLGEAGGPPISDNDVKLRVLTQISKGENQLIFEGFYLDGCAPLECVTDGDAGDETPAYIHPAATRRFGHRRLALKLSVNSRR
jgi:hypothetical protein